MNQNSLAAHIRKHGFSHIIFDFDYTLFKMVLDWGKFFNFERDNLMSLNADILERYESGSLSWSEMQNTYVREYGEQALMIIRNNNDKAEHALLQRVEPNYELVAFIKERDDLTFYIWSSNTRSTIESVLADYSIAHRISEVVSRTDVQYLKPDPEGFSLIHTHASVHKNKYLFVGDNSVDREAAEAVGIAYLLVDTFD